MTLATMLEITAGGAGSGCHGPNCGRPATGIKYTLVAPVPGVSDIHAPFSTRYTVSKYAKRAATSDTPLVPSDKGVATYQQNTATMMKTTGKKWMTLPHTFKGYFNQASQVTSLPQNAHVTVLQGPGKKNGGTAVTVTRYMKLLGAPLDRLHVKEQDTDEDGSIFRTRARNFVQVGAGLKQINDRYGVKL